jgi:hypothetical protein
MDYSAVLKNSGRTLWRYRMLWLLGLLLISANLPSLVITHLYMRFVLSFPNRIFTAVEPDDLFQPILDVILNPTVVIAAILGLFFVFALVWIISTIGETALIKSVSDYRDGRSHAFGEMLSYGVRLLARIIAIDTVLFLPLFLIVLFMLLAVGGGLIGSISTLTQPGATPDDLGSIGLVVGLVVMLLIILAVPVTLVTMLFRTVAIRSAIIEDLPTRPSIRRAWALIRSKIGQIIILVLLLYAVSYAIGMVTSVIIMPVGMGGSFIFTSSFSSGQLLSQGVIDAFLILVGLFSLISLIPNMFYRIFASAVWTLAYREWQEVD